MTGRYVVFDGLDVTTVRDHALSFVERLKRRGIDAIYEQAKGMPINFFSRDVFDFFANHPNLDSRARELISCAVLAEQSAKIKELMARGCFVVSSYSCVGSLAETLARGVPFNDIKNLLYYSVQCYPEHIFFLKSEPRKTDDPETFGVREENYKLALKQYYSWIPHTIIDSSRYVVKKTAENQIDRAFGLG